MTTVQAGPGWATSPGCARGKGWEAVPGGHRDQGQELGCQRGEDGALGWEGEEGPASPWETQSPGSHGRGRMRRGPGTRRAALPMMMRPRAGAAFTAMAEQACVCFFTRLREIKPYPDPERGRGQGQLSALSVPGDVRPGVSHPCAGAAGSIKGLTHRQPLGHTVSFWLSVQSLSTSVQFWPGQAGAEEPSASVAVQIGSCCQQVHEAQVCR